MTETIQNNRRTDPLSAIDGSNAVTHTTQRDPLGGERRKVLEQARTDATQRPTAFRSLLALCGADALELAMVMKSAIVEVAKNSESPLAEITPYAVTMLRLQREGRRLLQVERLLGELDRTDGARLPRLTS
jgi:hypothetical protein